MQDEVRAAPKYRIILEREDGKPLNDRNGKVAHVFRSDSYLTKEYMRNLRQGLFTILDKELVKQRDKDEKLHKKTD